VIALCGCGRHSFENLDGSTGSADAFFDAFVPERPIAQYSFNEGAGQNVTSTIAGSSVNGTLGMGAGADALDPQWVGGQFGSALAFDATDDRVAVPYPPTGFFQTNTSNESVSVSAWIFPMGTASTYRVIYEIGGETNGLSIGLTDTGQLRFALRNGTAVQRSKIVESSSPLATGRWLYVTCTNDAVAGMNMYIYDDNGVQLDTASSSGSYLWRSGSDGIAIGNNPSNNSGLRGVLTSGPEPFDGILDEVRIYDRAISQAQIAYDLSTPLP
jgi:hypothetical protein